MKVRANFGTVKRGGLMLAFGLLVCGSAAAQNMGNAGYGQNGGKARAEQNERNQKVVSKQDLPAAGSMFIDADVLMNVKADEFVAVFGLAQEGASVQEASDKMDAVVKQFSDELKTLHVRAGDMYVDFIAEPKIYGYETSESTAREKLTGFELKKNVSVHYTDQAMLDKLLAAAAKAQIYDLIKVDYVVKDINAAQDKLMAEAAGVIKQKLARNERLLGVKAGQAAVVVERPAIYYPTQMYDSYTAAETESLNRPANMQRFTIVQARKGRTFYFNGLDGNGFDKVINPVIVEPVVQFTLYLKMRYEVVK